MGVNVLQKDVFIEWLKVQKEDYVVLGRAGKFVSDGKKKEVLYYFPEAFAAKDVRPLMNTNIAMILCNKEGLSKDLQEQIDKIRKEDGGA